MNRELPVVKKMAPTQPGAIKLHKRFGEQLFCVRYRTDPEGKFRYTTVELIIDEVEINKRPEKIVSLSLGVHERAARAQLIAAGAQWDNKTKTWALSYRQAAKLKMQHRIIKID
jgi:hypothetical protein